VLKVIEIGRVCIKTAGREAGRFCVVVKKVDDNFVMVTGPKSLTKVKRRRCNIEHLKPLGHKISIRAEAPDSDVEQEMKKGNVMQKIQAESSAAELLKEAEEEVAAAGAAEAVAVAEVITEQAAEKPAAKATEEAKGSKPEAVKEKKGIRSRLGLHRKKEHKEEKKAEKRETRKPAKHAPKRPAKKPVKHEKKKAAKPKHKKAGKEKHPTKRPAKHKGAKKRAKAANKRGRKKAK
jgi:large subunit ribosomal protein L14e